MPGGKTGTPARRGRPGHSLDSLLDVAVTVFNERGYDATSMGELATRLGRSSGAASSTGSSAAWSARPPRGATCAPTSTLRHQPPVVRHGELPLIEWYRPGGGLSADDLADALVITTFAGLRI